MSSHTSLVPLFVIVRKVLINLFRGIRRPFVIDLESANGTAVNDEQVPTSRYYELKSNDG